MFLGVSDAIPCLLNQFLEPLHFQRTPNLIAANFYRQWAQ